MNASFSCQFIVEKYLSGKRIDTFLARHLRNYTAFRLQRLVAAGFVKVNDLAVAPDHIVHIGERVRVQLIEPPDKLHDAEPLPIDILYEDPWLVVVNKSPGQVAHPAGNILKGTLSNALQFHFDQQTCRKGLIRPGVVHRLDQFTSGVMVVSKEHLTHRRLSIQFEQRLVRKTYLALVHGYFEHDRLMVDLAIGADPQCDFIRMSTSENAVDPKSAITEFCRVQTIQDFSLVKAIPRTGRLHQIRAHLAAVGFPIVDDPFYGIDGDANPMGDEKLVGRQALHASQIKFRHPIFQEMMTFTANLPPDMESGIRQLAVRSNEYAI